MMGMALSGLGNMGTMGMGMGGMVQGAPLPNNPGLIAPHGEVMCGDFKRGSCTRGDRCRYSHGVPAAPMADMVASAKMMMDAIGQAAGSMPTMPTMPTMASPMMAPPDMSMMPPMDQNLLMQMLAQQGDFSGVNPLGLV